MKNFISSFLCEQWCLNTTMFNKISLKDFKIYKLCFQQHKKITMCVSNLDLTIDIVKYLWLIFITLLANVCGFYIWCHKMRVKL